MTRWWEATFRIPDAAELGLTEGALHGMNRTQVLQVAAVKGQLDEFYVPTWVELGFKPVDESDGLLVHGADWVLYGAEDGYDLLLAVGDTVLVFVRFEPVENEDHTEKSVNEVAVIDQWSGTDAYLRRRAQLLLILAKAVNDAGRAEYLARWDEPPASMLDRKPGDPVGPDPRFDPPLPPMVDFPNPYGPWPDYHDGHPT